MMKSVMGSLLFACLACVGASAQHVQWTRQGSPGVGGQPVIVHDLSGDGNDDIALPLRVPIGVGQYQTQIWLASGADGSTLPQRIVPALGDDIQKVYALGDADGDGYPDLLIHGVWLGSGSIHAISGRTFQHLYTLQAPVLLPNSLWGYSVIGGVDVDNDGRTEAIVSDVAYGIVYVYEDDGSEKYHVSSPAGSLRQYLAPFYDYDGDGCDDFLVTVYENQSQLSGADIVSGRTGQQLRRVLGFGDFMDAVAGASDLDGDGLMDILLGGGNFAPGTVQAFSSVTGHRLWAWYSGYSGDLFGQRMLGTVDLDQDGLPDPLATSLNGAVGGSSLARGYASIYNGRDGSEIRFNPWSGTVSASNFSFVAAAPPLRGSSLPRALVVQSSWAFYAPSNYQSRWYMFEAGPEGVATVQPGCVGTLQHEPRMGLRQVAPGTSRVTLSGAEPGMLSLLALGLRTAPQPLQLTPFGFPNCVLVPDVFVVGVAIPGTSGVDAGYAHHDFARNFAASASLGMEVVGQYVVLGSGTNWPGGTTAVLRWYFQ